MKSFFLSLALLFIFSGSVFADPFLADDFPSVSDLGRSRASSADISPSKSSVSKVPSVAPVFSNEIFKPVPKSVALKPTSFDFQSIVVSQAVQLIFSEALKSPYVIAPDVLTDSRLVSFRYESSKGDIQEFVSAFLDSIDLVALRIGGIYFVKKKPTVKEVEAKIVEVEKEIFIYRPLFRDVDFLSRILQPLFKGSFTVNKSVAAAPGQKMTKEGEQGSAAAMIDQSSDVLVFNAEKKEIEKLKALLPQIDQRQGEVLVRAAVYEVSTSKVDGSAFSLMLSLLHGHLLLGVGDPKSLQNFVRLKNGTIDGVFSALSGDTRFNVVSTPSLRVRSGSVGTFNVGQDVPILGAITYPGNGAAPVQSIDYKSSGVLFAVNPTVHGSSIDLVVNQELSNFVVTETGVNGSPTKTKRSISTGLTLLDGDVIVIGGLTETKDSGSHTGLSFLPKSLHSQNDSSSKTEIVLILQVTKL